MRRFGEKGGMGHLPKKKKRRKEDCGDEPTLIEVYAQVAVHTTQFLLHMQSGSSQASLEDSIKRSFSFWMVGQAPQFLNTLYWGNLSFHHKLQCTESVAQRQVLAPPWAAPLVNWTTRFLRLRSCLVRSFSFGIFSCPFFHLCSSINPTLHHIVSNHTSFFSVNLFPFQNIARVHSPRPSDWTNSFLSYRCTGSSPKPFWTEAWPFHGGPSCALRRWREPRWLHLPVCFFTLPIHWVAFPQFFQKKHSKTINIIFCNFLIK